VIDLPHQWQNGKKEKRREMTALLGLAALFPASASAAFQHLTLGAHDTILSGAPRTALTLPWP
jgi:hypothetical protein